MFQPTTVEIIQMAPPLKGAKFDSARGMHVLQRDETGLRSA